MKRALLFLLALPFGLVMGLVLALVRASLRRKDKPPGLPENCILYFTHLKIWGVSVTRDISRNGAIGGYWLGYHGFLPYVFVMSDRILDVQFFLYERSHPRKPMEQVRDFLLANPRVRLGIATDSGGPYGKVRSSLVKLAIETGRPLVAMAPRPKRYFRIFGHELPRPFTDFSMGYSRPIFAKELAALSEKEALASVQLAFEQVNQSPALSRP